MHITKIKKCEVGYNFWIKDQVSCSIFPCLFLLFFCVPYSKKNKTCQDETFPL